MPRPGIMIALNGVTKRLKKTNPTKATGPALILARILAKGDCTSYCIVSDTGTVRQGLETRNYYSNLTRRDQGQIQQTIVQCYLHQYSLQNSGTHTDNIPPHYGFFGRARHPIQIAEHQRGLRRNRSCKLAQPDQLTTIIKRTCQTFPRPSTCLHMAVACCDDVVVLSADRFWVSFRRGWHQTYSPALTKQARLDLPGTTVPPSVALSLPVIKQAQARLTNKAMIQQTVSQTRVTGPH